MLASWEEEIQTVTVRPFLNLNGLFLAMCKKPVPRFFFELAKAGLKAGECCFTGIGLDNIFKFPRVGLQIKKLIFPGAPLVGDVLVILCPDRRNAGYGNREYRKMLV